MFKFKMAMKPVFFCAAGLSLVVATSVQADLKSDLRGAFNDMTLSNTTNPGVYRGQTATMFSGGGYTERTPVRNYQLYSMQMPRVRGGCGGIDIYTGGFSFINGDQVIAMMKNIASNAKGMAYKMAVDIVSAQIGNALSEFTGLSLEDVQQSINSCERATALVGFSVDTGSRTLCAQQRVGGSTSWSEAWQACGPGGANAQPVNESSTADQKAQADAAPFNGNLVWKAMHRANTFGGIDNDSGSESMRSMAMALTGTVVQVLETSTSAPRRTNYPSILLTDKGKQTIESLIFGGQHGASSSATVLRCDTTNEDGCLNPYENDWTVAPQDALFSQAKANLQALLNKIPTDEALDEADQRLLAGTRLPVYTLLAGAYVAGGSTLAASHLDELSEMLARDALMRYFESLLSEVDKVLDGATLDQQIKHDISSNIQLARQQIQSMSQRNLAMADQMSKMLDRHSYYKRILISKMPANTFVPGQLLGSGE